MHPYEMSQFGGSKPAFYFLFDFFYSSVGLLYSFFFSGVFSMSFVSVLFVFPIINLLTPLLIQSYKGRKTFILIIEVSTVSLGQQ